MNTISTDILIIGNGAAGLRAAVEAAGGGRKVLVVSKLSGGLGTSTLMSGGTFTGCDHEFTKDEHRARTLAAGRNLNQADLVRVFIDEAPGRLNELLEWGMAGTPHHGHLVATGKSPALGKDIIRCLEEKAGSAGAEFRDGLIASAIEPLYPGFAVLAYSFRDNEWLAFLAKSVILAGGGPSGIYLRHDNPVRMMGEGYALALRAGATLQDMEFAQFFPLLLDMADCPRFLIPPPLELQGVIVNDRGEDIHTKYGLTERPAAARARDRLSQAIFKETYLKGRGVYLDVRGVSKEDWCAHPFSALAYNNLAIRAKGLERKLKVAPGAHFFMGGVRIDPDCRSSVEGLIVCGEAAGGLHGANRLGGNALTETIVFGARAGKTAALEADKIDPPAESEAGTLAQYIPSEPEKTSGETVKQLKKELRTLMWQEAGIIRTAESLDRAESGLAGLTGRLARVTPKKMQDYLELKLGMETAELIVGSAKRREESRGAHFRADFPETDEFNLRGHNLVRRTGTGNLAWTFAPEVGDYQGE